MEASVQNTQRRVKKLLVVEDDFFIRDLYSAAAKSQGYEVLVAVDGQEALDQVRTTHPDIVLLDLMLPKIDGLTVLKTLKADKAVSSIPVIITTNLEDPAKEQEARSLGAADYFLKIKNTPTSVIEKLKMYLPN
jgi:CheY-like chemotaxis protein